MTGDQLSIDDALAGLGRVIPSRTDDPGTSHAAAKEIKIRANSQRAYLLQCFDYWPASRDGITDEEAMMHAARNGWVSPSSEYAKRCSELRDGGYIEPTGETRIGASGKARIVSKITEKGMAWIRENR